MPLRPLRFSNKISIDQWQWHKEPNYIGVILKSIRLMHYSGNELLLLYNRVELESNNYPLDY